ncbi:xylulokinase [Haploplasma axanthum]|nr:xylulokinase [Haploplasma axanthum]
MYIGIDLGTSGVKILLLSGDNKVVKTVTKGYDLLIPKPEWTEQNPLDWYNQTIVGLKEIIKGYEKDLKAISFSGQMHGMVLLDKNDKVIRNALLWNDQRTIKEVEYLNEVIGKERLIKETGNIALTGLTAPKVLWVKNNEEENYKRIDKVMLPKDYLIYRLSGIFASDTSDTSGTLYYDVENKKYSKYMLDVLGLKENNFPKIFESYEVVGYLTEEVKVQLGVKNDVKIVAGGGDQAVGAVGVGAVYNGMCNISLGTSGVVFSPMEKFASDQKTYLQSYVHSNGKYMMMGVMLNAAGALKWWNEGIFNNYNYENIFDKISKTSSDDDLFFLPYLTGERAPINDPYARGAFVGLRLEHKKEHLDRAVVEGITFNLKAIFEIIKTKNKDLKNVRITGGGAKSPIWGQMIADILNTSVETILVEEGPALGAAILAMVADGKYETVEDACNEIIEVKHIFKPNSKEVLIYEKKYNEYMKVYPKLNN